MPKLKKQPIRQKSVTPVAQAPPTPVPTQIVEEPEEEDEDDQDAFVDASSAPVTSSTVDFKYSIAKSTAAAPVTIPETTSTEDVDPMDTSKKIALTEVDRSNAIESGADSDSEGTGNDDNDLFKKPDEAAMTGNNKFRRQSSIHLQRRLSGITPSVIRNRSGSISVTPTPGPASPGVADDEDESAAPPVIIGIPTSKPTKRRKSSASVARRSSTKRGLIFLSLSSKDSSPPILEEPVAETKKRKYSVGIDPSTQKLIKYKIVDQKDTDKDEDVIVSDEDVKISEGKETVDKKEDAEEEGEEDEEEEEVREKSKKGDGVKSTEEENAAAVALLDLIKPTSRSRSASKSNILNSFQVAPALMAKNQTPTPAATQIRPPTALGNSSESDEDEDDDEEVKGEQVKGEQVEGVQVEEGQVEEQITEKTGASAPKAKQARKSRGIKESPVVLPEKVHSMSQVSRIWKNDQEATEGITIIPEAMRMSDLCLPSFSIGKPSTRYKQVIEAKVHQKKLLEERRKIRKIARAEQKSIEEVSGELEDKQQQKKKDILSELPDADQKQQPTLSLQLRVVGGTIAVDMDSTSVSRGLHNLNSEKDREEANPFNNPITSSTYSKRRYTDRWTEEEVQKFYEALSTWGTDFTFIAQLFPHRTRKQVKLKFNLEERKHPEIIELALRMKLPADFAKYCSESKKNILSLDEYNEELKSIRVKHEEEMKQIVAQKEQAKKEDEEASRRREFEYRTGTKQMSRSERARELRKNEVVVGTIDEDKKKNLV